jgi:hypothetical protein
VGTWSLSDLYTIAEHCRSPHGRHIKFSSDETHPGTHEEYLMKGPHVEAPAFMRGEGRFSAP